MLIIAGTEGIFKGREFYQYRLDALAHHEIHFIDGHHHIHLEKTPIVSEYISNFLRPLVSDN